MGQAGTKSAGFYPPWIGPEQGQLWTLMIGLILLFTGVAFLVPLRTCPVNDSQGVCLPPAPDETLPALSTVGLPLSRGCPRNASATVRTEPNARTLSNAVFSLSGPDANETRRLSGYAVAFAQFVLNDVYLPRPNGDYLVPIVPPDALSGNIVVPIPAEVDSNPISDTTPYFDLSSVYGTDMGILNVALRGGAPRGQLRVGADNLLPGPAPGPFVMGDARNAKSAGLIAMHTLAVRNHNYWAKEIARYQSLWSDDQIFWKARQLNVAEWQHIIYTEWLPALLGVLAPAPTISLSPEVTVPPGSTTRVHTEIATVVMPALIDTLIPDEMVFQNVTDATTLIRSQNVEPTFALLRRLRARAFDDKVANSTRTNVLTNGDATVDSVQRARVLRVTDWAATYTCFGTTPIAGDARDAYQGFLQEPVYPGTSMGFTMGTMLAEQFERLRQYDPRFYQSSVNAAAIGEIFLPFVKRATLRTLLYRNTRVSFSQLGSDNLFFVAG